MKLRSLRLVVTHKQRPHGGGDAARFLGIVRCERIFQLIKADRQVAATLTQRRSGAEKPLERAFGAVGDSQSACSVATMDVRCRYFCNVWVKYQRVPFSTIAPRMLPMVTGI